MRDEKKDKDKKSPNNLDVSFKFIVTDKNGKVKEVIDKEKLKKKKEKWRIRMDNEECKM